MKKLIQWFSALAILSYNAILNIILGGRNIGKTWAFKRRAYRRALKKGKRTIWVRRTKDEALKCAESFYESKDLQKFCGLSLYDKEGNPKGNVRQIGRTVYIKRNGRWFWFVKIIYLGQFKSMRSADDVDTDTIIYDEFTTTPEKYVLYRGNEAQDFIDLFISVTRQHETKIFCLGNKESVSNPILQYFGIPPIPLKWQGIRTFKKGTIALQQINDGVKNNQNNFLNRVNDMLAGTSYGDYLTKSTYKNQPKIILAPPPKYAVGYIQLYWRGKHIKIWSAPQRDPREPTLYITGKNDLDCTIFTDGYQRQFKHQIQLQKRRHRNLFRLVEQCVSDNRIAYKSYNDYENILAFYAWLGLKN